MNLYKTGNLKIPVPIIQIGMGTGIPSSGLIHRSIKMNGLDVLFVVTTGKLKWPI